MEESDIMRSCIFSVIMNIVAAIILFGKGALEMNSLETGIPAVLCIIAAILVIIQIRKEKKAKTGKEFINAICTVKEDLWLVISLSL